MNRKNSLKKDNRGASLLAVLVVLVVVSAIAVIITKLTITNIQMKEVERGGKKNFYSAESVMDELYAGVSEQASNVMGEAYQDVMENYILYTSSGQNPQDVFQQKYMEKLEALFYDGSSVKNQKTNAGGMPVYSQSRYNPVTIQNFILEAADRAHVVTAEVTPTYDADYAEGVFTLNGVKVKYTDSQGYETTITTDLVLTTPKMNFNGGSQIKDFMKYCLIADNKIDVNTNNVTVNGNAYAGSGGINALTNGAGVFNGKVTLTRGNITANAGSELTVGSGSSSSVWAENIETTGKSASKLVLNGNCYVADDLTVNGVDSTVELSGNYYGYNYQKNYSDTEEVSKDAAFSSAMMVNGRNSKLDLENLNYMMLAGRTYISRGKTEWSNPNDVMLGESLSARTNQLAYYVPANTATTEYVDASSLTLTEDGKTYFQNITGIANIVPYLAAKQVVAYHYIEKGTSSDRTNYYLNFASEQAANDYFAAYCNSSVVGSSMSAYASNYLTDNAVILDGSHIYTLKGDIMYRENTGDSFTEKHVSVAADDWKKDGAYFNYCSQLAVKYKSLQLGLSESRPGVTGNNVRITIDDDPHNAVNKNLSLMMDSLIDVAALKAEIAAKVPSPDANGIREYIPVSSVLSDGTHYQDVILVDNDGTANAYQIPADCTEGIVVATGNVYVDHSFTGLIISGGKVESDKLKGGSINFADGGVTVTSDEMMVSQMFADDMASGDPKFSQFFRDCSAGSMSGSITGNIDMKQYLNYENWTKN